MAKEGELWDDSALINAFDDAMSKYKKMHGKKRQDNSTDGEKVAGSTGENVVAVVDESYWDEAVRKAGENSNVVSNTATEMEESHCVDSIGPEPYIDSSNSQMQEVNGYLCSQGTEDYNQLLGRYYELEEKRQSILQQLHQLGGYNYQCPTEGYGSGVQWGTCHTSQEYSVPERQASLSNCIGSCCPYACHCSVAPCTSFATCSLGGSCVGKTCTDASAMMGSRKSIPLVDGDVIKTAIGAAERAISSMKMKTSADSSTEEKEKRKDSEGEMNQSTSSETDISVVLNAWYSAGFYTGKYLTEQSIAKKWHC